ncbi:hypothetical protein C499_03473 [Halogeometricum borinquense DSM 11551]|uniref:DUF456 domain-containing protein n=2 Tax=Halogeometricum borinquense TaxID=60847 RepID=E4NR50_HALBP|nr:DUF456 domain-containing protein [Halogeometricum borinquense]ADQ66786.1 Protein of unknown function (DUF456) [Halogeometricum borinquense DSM 11551]ELY30294.1 hypothetical protein C499_03473 [Halogeometricum borinquense DSM 11551]RYJ14243.1 DUF456 domain-containing protein [Halogeometricum borinquense]
MDPVALLAIGLAVVGVIGVVVPLVPGALVSVAGVLLYWWSTGYSEPSLLVLAALVLVGLVTVIIDYFGGVIAARAGGASSLTTAVGALVGFVLLFVTGPLGFLLGLAATVFAVEFYRNDNPEASARIALYTTVGVLASTVVQILLTGSILVVLVGTVVF